MDIIDELRSYRVETDLASWHPEICDRAADCITDLMARCDRLEEARENANEACAKWEGMYHMAMERAEKAARERDDFKAKYIEAVKRACELSKIVDDHGWEE